VTSSVWEAKCPRVVSVSDLEQSLLKRLSLLGLFYFQPFRTETQRASKGYALILESHRIFPVS